MSAAPATASGRPTDDGRSVRERLDRLDPCDLAAWAYQALHGKITLLHQPTLAATANLKSGMLRWALSDDPAANRQWRMLLEGDSSHFEDQDAELLACLRDRDRYVERLWERVRKESEQLDLRTRIVDQGGEAVFRDFLFDWFLRRFHPGAALRVAEPRKLAGRQVRAGVLYPVLAGLAVAALVGAEVLEGVFPGLGSIAAGVGGLVALYVGGWLLLGLPVHQVAQLLFPRLAAGVAVGYLFLAAAPELVGVMAEEPDLHAFLLAGLLTTATLLYTLFHVSQRVKPRLPIKSCLLRTLPLMALGAAYALLGLALFTPLFRLARFHEAEQALDLGPAQLLLLATVALALGMLLELVWEEKPLSEPL